MPRHFEYNLEELQRNRVLKYQRQQLAGICFDLSAADDCISSSEEILRALGYDMELESLRDHRKKSMQTPSSSFEKLPEWSELCNEANNNVIGDVYLEELFSKEELADNGRHIKQLNEDFDAVHRLDKADWTICAVAGIISAATDLLFVGIPGPTANGLKAGSLSNYIRDYFEKKYPPEQMANLGTKKFVKTPYDAQDNRYTSEYVEGLSAYYHRLLSLGHDPILGFIVGVMDIMRGTMTTIDKNGRIVTQIMDVYTDRKESNLFEALTKQLLHLKSDLTTSMGLPVPLMGLFNLLQFGNIGKEEQTIAEIVQGMYYEGYDFIHFCSMSIPVMLTEIIVRLCWGIKRKKEGYSLKDSLPFSNDRLSKPKLATMLFIAHSSATAINAGKVVFSQNPLAINYPQWLTFAKYAFSQLKWDLIEKPELRNKFVMQAVDSERMSILDEINKFYDDYIGICLA